MAQYISFGSLDLTSVTWITVNSEVMINRDNWGHSYCDVRGEILGSSQDEHQRKHLPKVFSSIKNES
ncbi:unnamed protein product [Parnassius mnemosyne]|uniref:Uncharacterized protein n=1 Tax=Parnassius mnemosyne TaxID=213953 RepID=A0AAV1M9B0_9NEOP